MYQIGVVAAFICLLGGIIYLSQKNGKKAAQLENLKAEIKKQAEEQARANKIIDNVGNMSDDDVRDRLRAFSGK